MSKPAKGMERTLARVAELVSKDLRTFGYPSCTDQMVKEIWWAMKRKDKVLPHDVIGMFAERSINDALGAGLVITDDAEPAKVEAATAKKAVKKK